ncbi:MAG TPA: peptide-methionine (S)-S-oxide reductase MsrA [Bacteroidia bacterium]|nr:peptide-methionine (S)-S-oxide reductase MsrA [Bacteroidia bacterium]
MEAQNSNKYQLATFGMGCFWCTEAIFQELKGVIKVTPGYAGGHKENPTYEEVCEGNTGHTEVTQIIFDPTQISYAELLEVFFKVHDPTTLNRQGNDVGYQYRSVIFYHNDEQKKLAQYYKQKLNEEKVYDNPIVTAIEPFTNFYPAEDYHKNYYQLNSNKPYCQLVIKPKLEKFEKVFRDKLKK